MTSLKCCKLFHRFYCAITKDIAFRFFNLYELFPAVICATNIGSLVNNLLRVKIFNPFPFFTYFQYYD